jgi:hypothetical protein
MTNKQNPRDKQAPPYRQSGQRHQQAGRASAHSVEPGATYARQPQRPRGARGWQQPVAVAARASGQRQALMRWNGARWPGRAQHALWWRRPVGPRIKCVRCVSCCTDRTCAKALYAGLLRPAIFRWPWDTVTLEPHEILLRNAGGQPARQQCCDPGCLPVPCPT